MAAGDRAHVGRHGGDSACGRAAVGHVRVHVVRPALFDVGGSSALGLRDRRATDRGGLRVDGHGDPRARGRAAAPDRVDGVGAVGHADRNGHADTRAPVAGNRGRRGASREERAAVGVVEPEGEGLSRREARYGAVEGGRQRGDRRRGREAQRRRAHRGGRALGAFSADPALDERGDGVAPASRRHRRLRAGERRDRPRATRADGLQRVGRGVVAFDRRIRPRRRRRGACWPTRSRLRRGSRR